ncbi:PAS domain S-box protein [Maribacter chungangensis]|uniref:histidine kinase n=1 Tax=Maribacter chungangensis TaxID=1069117 RepID=A0ABW3B5G5_9FLAO
MDSNKILLLKRALDRQKSARQQAEKILEAKSKELYDTTQHLKRANAKLENLLNEKTSELDGVFINIIDPYVVMDLRFNVVNMNSSAKDFLGYDHMKERVNLSKLVHKDFMEYTVESMKSLLEVGVLKNYRAKIYVKDGTVKWVQLNSSLVYDGDNRPVAAQGILRDITQEMEIKQLLLEQRSQLDIIVQNSPLGIVLIDDGKIIKANDTMTQLLGYEQAELKTMTVKHISNPEDEAEGERLVKAMKQGKLDNFSIVNKYRKKNGSELWAKTSVSAVKNKNGDINYLVALIEDITEQRAAENRLNAEREKYSSIIANMNLGLIEVDNDDIIQMTNQSFCSMSGFREVELLGNRASDILDVKNKNVIPSKTQKRKEGKSDSYEVEVLDKLGARKHWLISGAPRYDNDKNVIGSIGIHLDITNQKILEFQKERLLKELENSNKGLQEYAHIVSHDLKSPLRSISALSTWLYEDYKDVLDDTGRHNLHLMQEKVASMDKLIHGILEYSTANNSALDKTEVDLNTVITKVGDTIFIPDHVQLAVPKRLPVILADATKMQQLFQNIIGNAVMHIEKEQGLVEVLFSESDTHWSFTIRDNGVGIPKEYHEKIFQIFQSIGNKERSTGIGLSIVKKIIDRYGGEIWVDSELGTGTAFHFTLNKEICSLKPMKITQAIQDMGEAFDGMPERKHPGTIFNT